MGRLRRARPASPGLGRVRRGRGFGYLDERGRPLRDEEPLARIRSLVIPPAWTEVWIAPHADDHIQVIGVDADGRRQYRYHERWTATRGRVKFDRMLELARALPAARAGVTRDLALDGLGHDRVLAGAFRLLDLAGLRIGDRRSADERGTIGLTTLLGSHVTVRGSSTVALRFTGKSGRLWDREVEDAALAALVASLKRGRSGEILFAWRGDDDVRRALTPAEVNVDLRRRTGAAVSAKDVRTLHGTATAAMSLARSGWSASARERKSAVTMAIEAAAVELENTPAIARSSYVDPRVVDRYERGQLVVEGLNRRPESIVLELLG